MRHFRNVNLLFGKKEAQLWPILKLLPRTILFDALSQLAERMKGTWILKILFALLFQPQLFPQFSFVTFQHVAFILSSSSKFLCFMAFLYIYKFIFRIVMGPNRALKIYLYFSWSFGVGSTASVSVQWSLNHTFTLN